MRTTPESRLAERTADCPGEVYCNDIMIAQDRSIGLQELGGFVVEVCPGQNKLFRAAVEDFV